MQRFVYISKESEDFGYIEVSAMISDHSMEYFKVTKGSGDQLQNITKDINFAERGKLEDLLFQRYIEIKSEKRIINDFKTRKVGP